ncbi:MAG: hypothetical protein IT382_01805 [Deltaproteobacteria bacterium]|nr:hypothetical protein [Deltaproteobacteria bacterium]
MIPAGYAADLKAARPFECEASGAPGTYGAAVRVRDVQPGLYLVIVSNPATVRDADTDSLRASGTRQLEVPFRADVPMAVALTSGSAVLAAYGMAAAVVWLVPLQRVC